MSISLKKILSHLKRGEHWIWLTLSNGLQLTPHLHAVLMYVWITHFLSTRYMLLYVSSFVWAHPISNLLYFYVLILVFGTITFLTTSSSMHFHFADPLVFCLQFFHDGDFPHWLGVYDINAHTSQRLCKICSGRWWSRDSGNELWILPFFAYLIGTCLLCRNLCIDFCVLRSLELVSVESVSKSCSNV